MISTLGAMRCVALVVILSFSSALRAENLDNRVRRLEQILDNQVLVNLLQRIDGLEREIRELRGELEAQQNQWQSQGGGNAEQLSALEARLSALEQQTAGAAALGEALASDGSADATLDVSTESGEEAAAQNALAASPTGSEQGDYDAAMRALKQGDYVASSDAFMGFLTRYPKSDLADNAKYWLGESYYIVRAFESAAEAFSRVIEEHPDSGKSADARLKLAFCYHELNRQPEAVALLKGLIQEFPDTSVSRLAAKRLKRLQ